MRFPERVLPTAKSLLLACHPLPTAAVTGFAAALGVAAGATTTTTALLTAAVLAGQLSIGWLNDLLDRDRDRQVGRLDKPLAVGDLQVRIATLAFAVALAACIGLSLALGLLTGITHLVAVGMAQAYNVWLKRTVWSWLPFATGFGLLPAVAWMAAGSPAPWWLVTAGALLGVGAHGANVLPDRDDDRATGVLGLPQRLPAPVLRAGTFAALIAALTTLTLGPAGRASSWEIVLLGVAGGLTLVVLIRPVRPRDRAAFLAAVGIAMAGVTVLLIRSATG